MYFSINVRNRYFKFNSWSWKSAFNIFFHWYSQSNELLNNDLYNFKDSIWCIICWILATCSELQLWQALWLLLFSNHLKQCTCAKDEFFLSLQHALPNIHHMLGGQELARCHNLYSNVVTESVDSASKSWHNFFWELFL